MVKGIFYSIACTKLWASADVEQSNCVFIAESVGYPTSHVPGFKEIAVRDPRSIIIKLSNYNECTGKEASLCPEAGPDVPVRDIKLDSITAGNLDHSLRSNPTMRVNRLLNGDSEHVKAHFK